MAHNGSVNLNDQVLAAIADRMGGNIEKAHAVATAVNLSKLVSSQLLQDRSVEEWAEAAIAIYLRGGGKRRLL